MQGVAPIQFSSKWCTDSRKARAIEDGAGGGGGETGDPSECDDRNLCFPSARSATACLENVERYFGGGDELAFIPAIEGRAGVGLFGFQRGASSA